MSVIKQTKDYLCRFSSDKKFVPSGLAEFHHYFRMYDPIRFKFETQEDGSVVAFSENFRFGSIITYAKNKGELDKKISDAILTAFEIPSSYAKEAAVHRVDEKEYAFA